MTLKWASKRLILATIAKTLVETNRTTAKAFQIILKGTCYKKHTYGIRVGISQLKITAITANKSTVSTYASGYGIGVNWR